MAIRALFIGGGGSSALIFSSLQRFSVLRTSKRCFPTPATIIFPCRFHARHWLWIRLGLEAAAGQTITRTTDEANLFIHMFMRENSRFELMRAIGAKAVASVEMAVPPTMVAGELSVEISEGETSGDDFSDGDYTDIDE